MPFWGHDAVPMIDADTAAAEVEQGAALIDIGEPKDWYAGHLPHATLIETELVTDELAAYPKERTLVLAARERDLAESVAAMLREKGYDAAVLTGGPSA